MATEHPTPTLTGDEIEAMGTLVAAVIAADAHVGLGLRDVHAASLAGRIWAELAVLGYQVQPLADKIDTDVDPYIEAAEAEYAGRHPSATAHNITCMALNNASPDDVRHEVDGCACHGG